MKKKILFVFLVFSLVFSSCSLAFGYVVVDSDSGAGKGDLNYTGREYMTRTFYSNYSNRFYMVYGWLPNGFPNWQIQYSSSRYGLDWTDRVEIPCIPPGVQSDRVTPAYYIHPDGRFIEYCYEINTDDLYWGRMEILLNGSIIENIPNTLIIDGDIGTAPIQTNEVHEEFSIVVDSAGFVYIAFELTSAHADPSYGAVKSRFNNGTWNFEEFEHAWLIEGEWVANGHANPPNINWGGKIFPMKGGEDIGVVFWYFQTGTLELHYSMYYDNSTDDWIDLGGGLFNDDEAGDWANDCWTLGYDNELAVFFKQHESNPDGVIGLEAKFLDMDNHQWENQTQISFDIVGDEGAVEFMPLVSVNENTNTTNFVWGIVGNDTIWYNRMYQNGTLEGWAVLENLDYDLLEDEFSSTPRSFSPMSVGFFDNENPDGPTDTLYHTYLEFLDDDWSIPAIHLNTTLYEQDYTLADEWIFEGEVYHLVSYIENASRFFVNSTDSRHQIRFQWNNETEQMWISVDPADQFTIGLPFSNFTRYGNITRLQWTFIPDRSIIDCEGQLWGYYIENSDMDFNATASMGYGPNIYNLGGITYYEFEGDGGRTVGGHPWELHATDGATGSSARAEQIYRKLQHIHFLIEIDMDNEWDSQGGEFDFTPGVGFVDIGIDYWLDGAWVEGFYVRLYVQSADVGNHGVGNDMDWIEWSVDWYNYDPGTGTHQNFRSGLIFSNYWGYENENLDPDYHNRTSAQLWVDIWFDRTNASTTVSGQINSMYYGMKEHGSAWWFGYGVFQPMKGEYENAMALDDLYDEGGNVTDSMKFDLMRVFVEVEKVNIVAGNDETWTIRAIENINRKLADDRMQGIEQPSFEETLVLEMPMFQSLNPLVRAIDGISVAIWKGALGFQKILWGAMDSFFAWAGFGTGFFSRITAFLGAIPELFLMMMENIPIMIQNMVQLVDDVFGMVVRILPEFVLGITWLTESIINYWTTITSFFTGGILPINIIQDLQLGAWIRAGFALLPAYEMFSIIWAKDSGKKLKERADFYSMLFNGVINFVKGAISFMQSFIQTIMDILPG